MIVLDANILIAPSWGDAFGAHRRLRGQGVRFFAPNIAFDDAEKYLPPHLKKRGKLHADFSGSLRYLRNIIEASLPNWVTAFAWTHCKICDGVVH